MQRLILDHGPEVYDTLRAVTGSGGDHLYFRRPAGLEIGNSAGRLGPGLDVRAIGGYVIAPPSVHPNGRPYAWAPGTEGEPAPLPPSLVPSLTAVNWRHADIRGGQPLLEGQRNDRLFRLACHFRAAGLTGNEIAAALLTVNASRCRPPLPDRDVQRIADSATRYRAGPTAGTRSPRLRVWMGGRHA